MLHYRRILVIYNPAAGQRKLSNVPRKIEEHFTRQALDFEIRETQGAGDALRWARSAHAEGYDLVAAAGGDGTVRECVEGIMRSGAQVPLAQIMTGSGNVTARAFSIPVDLKGALDTITTGKVTRFDVGYLPEHDRHFVFIAGAGYDARLIHDTPRHLKKSLGFFAYLLAGVKHFFTVRPVKVDLEMDDEVRRIKAHTIMAINIGSIAAIDWAVAPDIDAHDGKLNIMVMSSRSLLGSIIVLVKILTKRYHGFGALKHYQAERIRVTADPQLPVQIDGEPLGMTPFVAHVIPNGMPFVVPVDYE
ncbi:MAG: diacylglycerol/lipid kinase family protein [Candidatus Krumholzibacteriia bacterium]